MLNYKVLVTDEAIEDIFDYVKYIHLEFCNPDAAETLYQNLNREVKNTGDFPLKFSDSGIKYRGYIIHKKVFKSYLIFYIINDERREVYVLRVIKDLMNWSRILRDSRVYHFAYGNIVIVL